MLYSHLMIQNYNLIIIYANTFLIRIRTEMKICDKILYNA